MEPIKLDPKWLTAEQAKSLSGITAEDYVTELLESVKLAAKAHKTQLKTTHSIYQLPAEFWSHEGNDKTPKYLKAIKILQELGYKASHQLDIGSFSVDSYTLVSW